MTTAISVLPSDDVIRKLHFGVTKKEQQLIAVLSDHDLAAWDLSSHLCLWRVTTRPDAICKDLSSGLFAAFFGSKICLFELKSPTPKHVVISSNVRRVIAATFACDQVGKESDETGEISRLYFITEDQKLMCLKKQTDEDEDEPKASKVSAGRTPFAELLAAGKASKQKSSSSQRQSTYETNMQLLSGASHTLPAVATIGPRFAESCLAKKESNREDADVVFPDISSEITFASLKLKYSG